MVQITGESSVDVASEAGIVNFDAAIAIGETAGFRLPRCAHGALLHVVFNAPVLRYTAETCGQYAAIAGLSGAAGES